jgi:insulysin
VNCATREVAARERIEELERPALHDRAYRIITLPNKIEVLLIHDVKTDKAGAAIDVNARSFGNLRDITGIAHAVEHLLFIGTENVSRTASASLFIALHLSLPYAGNHLLRSISLSGGVITITQC